LQVLALRHASSVLCSLLTCAVPCGCALQAFNGRVHAPPTTVRAFRDLLVANAPALVQFLASVYPIASANTVVAQKLFACFDSWVRFCAIPPDVVVQTVLLDACFQGIAVPQLFDVCVECVVSMLHRYCVLDKHIIMIQALIPRVMALTPLYQAATKAEDDDQAKGLCRVFAEMAERYIALIVGAAELNQVRARC
jgi:transportin-3